MRTVLTTQGGLSTESSEVLAPWAPTATLVLVTRHSLIGDAPSAGTWRVDSRQVGHVLMGIGLFGHAELSLDLPTIIHQSGQADASRESLTPAGIGDLRATVKGTIIHLDSRGFGLGVALDTWLPTGESRTLAAAGGVSVAPQVIAEYRGASGLSAIANLGYTVRPDVSLPNYAIGDALTYRVAGRIAFGADSQFAGFGEFDGAIGVVDGADHPLVSRTGISYLMRSGTDVTVFVGGSLIKTFGSGDVQAGLRVSWAPPSRTHRERAFRGARRPSARALVHNYEETFAPQPKQETVHRTPEDIDGDGILANIDACPSVAEDFDGFEDADGCPEFDNDRDAIADPLDMCKDLPEIINGFADWDGCPDIAPDDAHPNGQTLDRLVDEDFFPTIETVPGLAELDSSAKLAAAKLAELLQLNPWLIQVELRATIANPTPGQVLDPSGPVALAATAQAERLIDSILAALVKHGVEPWRVHRGRTQFASERDKTLVTVHRHGSSSGNRSLAPAPAYFQEIEEKARREGEHAERMRQASQADPSQHQGPTTPRLDTSTSHQPRVQIVPVPVRHAPSASGSDPH